MQKIAFICREKEKSSSAAKRGAEPAKASLDKVQQEMQGLNQQLAEAVQAAEAAEGRYRQAVAGYRYASPVINCFWIGSLFTRRPSAQVQVSIVCSVFAFEPSCQSSNFYLLLQFLLIELFSTKFCDAPGSGI